MVDYEVESTLREIRERVMAESARAGAGGARHSTDAAACVEASGGIAGASVTVASDPARGGASVESLARMQANLATTERAWSRLPPIMSYRRGTVARVELWLKRQISRAAHWFTWEQVNFNSAAHNALADALVALAAHERSLEELREALRRRQSEAESSEARASELQARLEAFAARLDGAQAQISSLAAEQRAGVEHLRAEQQALAEQLRVEQREQIQALATGLRNEAREHVEHALEEQRVCFKQLSLESAEAAVAQDRARRQIEARIEALETKAATGGK